MAGQQTSAIPQFVTTPIEDGKAPQTLQKIAAVDSYLVQYMDGEGKQQVRIVFKVPGSDAVFVLNNQIAGQSTVKNSTGWFNRQFNDMLKKQELEQNTGPEGAESI